MARRKARIPQGKKLQPAVDTMVFDLSVSGGLSNQYIDLSQCASLMNRRFYRQGLNWAVAGFTWIAQGNGSMTISKIPDTWVASNAWMKGFATWQKLNNEALEEAESVKAKFTDFKVFMDSDHHTLGSAANLIPRVVPGVPYATGRWDYSKQVIPKTDGTDGVNNFEIIWTGANYPGSGASSLNAVSLIEGYAASRGLPDIRDPNVPDDAYDADGATPENWMSASFNEGTSQDDNVLTDLVLENNIAPYPFENDGTATDTQYPGGANQAPGVQEHDISLLTATTVGGHTSFKGGNFQGGLIKLSYTADQTSFLIVHLVRGPHRGYMCQPMQDV
jgi:hypothetical protein